jgi:hypothetical protein
MRNTPYTTSTGVQIGLRYNESPKPMPIDDPDMIAIQGWFICKPQWHKARNMERVVLSGCTVFAVLIMIAMWVKQ